MARHMVNFQFDLIFTSLFAHLLCGYWISISIMFRVAAHTHNEPACCELILAPTNGASVFFSERYNRVAWKIDCSDRIAALGEDCPIRAHEGISSPHLDDHEHHYDQHEQHDETPHPAWDVIQNFSPRHYLHFFFG